MYTIIVDNNNDIIATNKTSIMQGSSLVDSIHILVPKKYGDIDMSEYTNVIMEYILPVSKKYKVLKLELNNENYDEGYLEYIVEGTTEFTAEAGDVKFTITFYKLELTDGKVLQYVRKTKEGKIHVCEITVWSDIIPDEALTPLDQRIIALEAMAIQYAEIEHRYNELMEKYQAQKVSDIAVDENSLYLSSASGKVGSGVDISDLSLILKQSMVGVDADGLEDGNVDLDTAITQINV